MGRLALVPICLPDRARLLDGLAPHLERAVGVEVEVRHEEIDIDAAYDPSRGQYRTTPLLRQLLDRRRDGDDRILGVAGVDLFIPVLTYVFGEAQVNGHAALVSTHRLRAESYGLPRDDNLLLARLEKESTHELGHTFGLIHCPLPPCVMHASTYVEEIDLKHAGFCDACLREVRASSRKTSAAL